MAWRPAAICRPTRKGGARARRPLAKSAHNGCRVPSARCQDLLLLFIAPTHVHSSRRSRWKSSGHAASRHYNASAHPRTSEKCWLALHTHRLRRRRSPGPVIRCSGRMSANLGLASIRSHCAPLYEGRLGRRRRRVGAPAHARTRNLRTVSPRCGG